MRKETIVRIVEDGNRDNGREFLIKEMSAIRAEKWATKALLAIVASGADIGDDVDINGGIAELAKIGLKSLTGLKHDLVEPLMDEMFECFFYLKEPGNQEKRTQLTVHNCENYIEEVSTILKLRTEALSLHVGFSVADKISASLPGQDKKAAEQPLNTETSPATSGQSFPEKWQQKKN